MSQTLLGACGKPLSGPGTGAEFDSKPGLLLAVDDEIEGFTTREPGGRKNTTFLRTQCSDDEVMGESPALLETKRTTRKTLGWCTGR